MKINWKKAIGFGVGLWILMFVIISIFIGFKIYDNTAMYVVSAIIGGVISYILAKYAKPADRGTAFVYAASWVVVGVILDAIVTRQFNGEIFSQWSLWLGYGLVLVAPLVWLQMEKKSSAPVSPKEESSKPAE